MQLSLPFNVPGGSVDIKTGPFELDQGGSSTGAAFNIEADGTLRFENAYTFDTSTTIVGTGMLNQNGFTTLVLPGNYTFTGTTLVNEGTLQVAGSLIASAVTLGSGTLSGTGTVGAVSGGAGNISPGNIPGPGILNAQGHVDLPEEGSFTVALDGATAGTGYSQLNVTGSVNLAGSELTGSLGFTPASGAQFTIIRSTAPVIGTFSGLNEGDSLTIGNTLFTITYRGGNGNDVVLNQSGTVTPTAPTVNEVIPNTGFESGGTLVTILGHGFSGATEVEFGAIAAGGLDVLEDSRLTVISPPGTGVVDVTVVTPGGTSATSPLDKFTYTPTPATQVTGITPSNGPAAGGTLVTITGIGFTGATAVDFGTVPATDFTVVNDTTITASSPPGILTVDITVVTPDGTSPNSVFDEFTYGPTVTGISPNSGPEAGGTSVTITGTGFATIAEVDFGSTPALGSIEITDTTLTINSPPGTGVVDVTVRTASGVSGTSSADRFTYIADARPTITEVTPNSGPDSGGTLVTITGTGFTGATEVDFGATAATNVTVLNTTTITANSPPGTGKVDVIIVTSGGKSAASTDDQFSYVVVPPNGDAPPIVDAPPKVVSPPIVVAQSKVDPSPTVVSLARFGFHMQPTSVVITFSSALDPERADDVNNYHIVTMGGAAEALHWLATSHASSPRFTTPPPSQSRFTPHSDWIFTTGIGSL